ncbi:MAG: diguanylate cyclase response regulator [Pirellula sp.]|nr:diguanylate cyclase response regulator [Pirellula sp.]
MRILVADDEPMSRRLLQSSLTKWGYEVVTAADGLAALAVLQGAEPPSLAILDWMMPGMEGVKLCEEIRAKKAEPYTYVILLTNRHSLGDIIQGLEAGADDYVRKPFDPSELKVRVATGERILALQAELISARDALRDQATRDHLTRVWNRAAILAVLDEELDRARRDGSSCGLLMVDLDNFKRINDTFGHAAGDEVLRETARTLVASTRRYDSVGRYGGEEFLIVLPGCDEVNSVSHAERLRTAVANLAVAAGAGIICPTLSLGVAIVDGGEHDVAAADLIHCADVALYQAKANGRDRVEVGRLPQLTPTTCL